MGIGIGLLANSRPFEGLIFCVTIAVALFIWLFSKRSPRLEIIGPRVLLPLLCVLSATAVFTGYYNWRVTNNSFVLPRALYQRERLNLPLFSRQSPRAPLHYSNPQFEQFYNVEQKAEYSEYKDHFARSSWRRLQALFVFFFGPWLVAPVLTLPWLLRDRRMRLLITQLSFSLVGLLVVWAFFIHYAAPLTAALLALAMQGMRHLRHWQNGSRPVGTGLTRAIVLVCIIFVPAHAVKTWRDAHRGIVWINAEMLVRARIVRQLEATPGEHLVIVRYSPEHDVHQEWVYNAADIDHSKIVWARQIPGVDLKPLLDYFQNRSIWTIEPDSGNVQLHPYTAPAFR
jgi:4-amino-4-deoxy-L-arabinose transferase-like glycosyltransferase